MLFASRFFSSRAKSLPDLLRQFRLAGAHPDMLYGIDPDKARSNGEALVLLENVLTLRETSPATARLGTATTSGTGLEREYNLTFWLRKDMNKEHEGAQSIGQVPLEPLYKVHTTLTPYSSDAVVKQQLKDLFRQAGLDPNIDFNLPGSGHDAKTEAFSSLLASAGRRQIEHADATAALYSRGDRALQSLRDMGVMIILNDSNSSGDIISYLVSLPFGAGEQDGTPYEYRLRQCKGSSGIANGGGLLDSNGQISLATLSYVQPRGWKLFQFDMINNYSAAEHLVNSIERLCTTYSLYRGRALRGDVCLVLETQGAVQSQLHGELTREKTDHRGRAGECRLCDIDGCIILPLTAPETWEAFLFSLTQLEWAHATGLHRAWRAPPAPAHEGRMRNLIRVADILGVHSIAMDSTAGCYGASATPPWEESLIAQLLADEAAIRRTMKKYNIDLNQNNNNLGKKRCQIRFVRQLTNGKDSGSNIDYRITESGTLLVSGGIKTPQLLRILRDHYKALLTTVVSFDAALASLVHAGTLCSLDVSLSEDVRSGVRAAVAGDDLVTNMKQLTQTLRQHHNEVSGLVRGILHKNARLHGANNNYGIVDVAPLNAGRLHVVVTHRGSRPAVTPNGALYLPFDIDLSSLRQALLAK